MAFHPLTVKIVSYLACAAVIVVLGVIDDYRQLGVKIRLGVQVLVALVMIYSSEYIHS